MGAGVGPLGLERSLDLIVQAAESSGSGKVIFTASLLTFQGGITVPGYAASKGGIGQLTQAFANECGPLGIRVNAILPGLTDTKFASALTSNDAVLQMVLPQIPLGRVAEPAEIAPAFLYLASDAGRYVTGSCVTVDGGFMVG